MTGRGAVHEASCAAAAAQAAETSIERVDRKDLSELRRLNHPPEGVPDAIFAVLALLGVPRQQWTWPAAQSRMKDINRFLDTDLAGVKRQIEEARLPCRNIALLRPLLELDHMKNISTMQRKSRAAASLLQAVLTLVEYYDTVTAKSLPLAVKTSADDKPATTTTNSSTTANDCSPEQYLPQYFREAVQIGGPLVAEALAKELVAGLGLAARQQALEVELRPPASPSLHSEIQTEPHQEQLSQAVQGLVDDGAARPHTFNPNEPLVIPSGGGEIREDGAKEQLKARIVSLELELEAEAARVKEFARQAQESSALLAAEIDGKKQVNFMLELSPPTKSPCHRRSPLATHSPPGACINLHIMHQSVLLKPCAPDRWCRSCLKLQRHG